MLTGYGGPVISPLGGHVENPATGENVSVPGAGMEVDTGPNGEHQHVGNAVTYSIHLDGMNDDGQNASRINADVNYESRDVVPDDELIPNLGQNGLVYSSDLDMYLYDSNGDIVDSDIRKDAGNIGFSEGGLSEGSYTALLVARHRMIRRSRSLTEPGGLHEVIDEPRSRDTIHCR